MTARWKLFWKNLQVAVSGDAFIPAGWILLSEKCWANVKFGRREKKENKQSKGQERKLCPSTSCARIVCCCCCCRAIQRRRPSSSILPPATYCVSSVVNKAGRLLMKTAEKGSSSISPSQVALLLQNQFRPPPKKKIDGPSQKRSPEKNNGECNHRYMEVRQSLNGSPTSQL